MMTPSQAAHRALAEDADRRALTARTAVASRALRRVAAAHRTEAILAAYREGAR